MWKGVWTGTSKKRGERAILKKGNPEVKEDEGWTFIKGEGRGKVFEKIFREKKRGARFCKKGKKGGGEIWKEALLSGRGGRVVLLFITWEKKGRPEKTIKEKQAGY